MKFSILFFIFFLLSLLFLSFFFSPSFIFYKFNQWLILLFILFVSGRRFSMKFTLHRIGIYQQRIDQIVEGAIRPAMVSYALNLRGADYYCWFRASMLVMPLPVAHRRLILIGLCCRHCWSHIRHRRIWNSIVSCYFNCLLFETSLLFVKRISRKGMSNSIID